ncbi:MAG: hypothetical protein HF973_09220 [Chloroflexi bacterium]|nr:hypothetical protein [Chloroflexota bacterium]
MPIFKTGNMWTTYENAGLFLITTNSTLKKGTHALVMGRGIARQARDRFPGLDAALGKQILSVCGNQGQYGLLVSPRWPEARLGAFQVKQHYSHVASLELIQRSTTALCAWCAEHPAVMVAVNFPGIGNGRLRREDVLPIVAQLPDQVTIWEYPPLGKENAR